MLPGVRRRVSTGFGVFLAAVPPRKTRVAVDFGKNAFEACKPFRCDQRPCNNKWLPSAIFVVFGYTNNNNKILFVSTDGRKILSTRRRRYASESSWRGVERADFGRGGSEGKTRRGYGLDLFFDCRPLGKWDDLIRALWRTTNPLHYFFMFCMYCFAVAASV